MRHCWRRFTPKLGFGRRWPVYCCYILILLVLLSVLIFVTPLITRSEPATRVISVVIGAVISVWLVLLIEVIRHPDLVLVPDVYSTVHLMSKENPVPQQSGTINVRQIRIINKQVRVTLGFLHREVAKDCRGDVVFRDENGKRVVFCPSSKEPKHSDLMHGRWAHSPQPINYAQQLGGILLNYWDIPAHDESRGILGIAFRHQEKGEAECYGLSNAVYDSGWRPPLWKLEPGIYLVDVEVIASNAQAASVFVLNNQGADSEGFELEEACDEQIELVRRKRIEEKKDERQQKKAARKT